MATNYFEGISIDDLANYNPEVDSLSVKSFEVNQTKTEDGQQKVVVKDKQTGEEINDNIDVSFSIDELANIALEEDTNDKQTTSKSKPASGENTSSSVTNSVLSSLASNLHKTGILEDIEEEELANVKDEASLYELIQKQIKANEYKSLNEDQKLLLRAMENGIPEAEVIENRKNSAYYKSIADETIMADKDLQANLIYQSLLIRNFGKEEAKKLAIAAVNAEDVSMALDAKESIIKYTDDILKTEIENEEKRVIEEQVKARQKVTELKQKIDSTSDIIPGVTINSTTKEKVFNSITKTVAVDQDGVPMNEVLKMYTENNDYKMKLHALHVLTKGFTDFSKLQKETKTNIVKGIKEEFNNFGNGGGNSNGSGAITAAKIADWIPQF